MLCVLSSEHHNCFPIIKDEKKIPYIAQFSNVFPIFDIFLIKLCSWDECWVPHAAPCWQRKRQQGSRSCRLTTLHRVQGEKEGHWNSLLVIIQDTWRRESLVKSYFKELVKVEWVLVIASNCRELTLKSESQPKVHQKTTQPKISSFSQKSIF